MSDLQLQDRMNGQSEADTDIDLVQAAKDALAKDKQTRAEGCMADVESSLKKWRCAMAGQAFIEAGKIETRVVVVPQD